MVQGQIKIKVYKELCMRNGTEQAHVRCAYTTTEGLNIKVRTN